MVFFTSSSFALDYDEVRDFAGKVYQDAKKTAENPEFYDAYVPVYAWHNRLTYDQEKIDGYNENPWGIGFGVARKDEKGNEDRLFFMGFKDSNDHFQTAFGYAWHTDYWESDDEDFRLGWGMSATLMQRSEYWYIPLPVPLPMVSATYKNIAVEATYIPGVKNDGNVLFIWSKFRLYQPDC